MKLIKFFSKDLPVTRVELDEMWSFVRRKTNNGEEEDPVSTESDSSDSEEGQQWTWINFAPEYRLILGIIVGPRTAETALSLIALTAGIVMGVPCFFSDGFSCYYNALLEHYHQLKVFLRIGKPGRPKQLQKKWRPRTPAMVAGITDHAWEFRELLTYKYLTKS